MLPRDSPSTLTQIKISGFENALEDALPDPRDIDRLYTIERAYQQNTSNLIDALEQTCLILMRDPMLLEAFMDIPRYDYQFDIQVDQSFDLWLLLSIRGEEPIRRRLGGGFAEDSGKCLLCLPQYADMAAELLSRIPETSEGAGPSNRNDNQKFCSSASEVTILRENTSVIVAVPPCRPPPPYEEALFEETVSMDSEEDEVEELLQPTLMNTEVSFTSTGSPITPEDRHMFIVFRDENLNGDPASRARC